MIVPFLLPVTLLAEGPRMTAPISVEDVREVCSAVASATPDQITSISAVISMEFVPGALATQCIHVADDGTEVRSTCYARADLVWVLTVSPTGVPMQYKVQKASQGWKIISKGPPPTA
jgi:hypothetical protein